MAHVIRIKGSPDKWLAHGPDGWVNEQGNTEVLKQIPDGKKEEFKGEAGDRKVELLGGFGGRVFLEKKPPVATQPTPATGSVTGVKESLTSADEKPKTKKTFD